MSTLMFVGILGIGAAMWIIGLSWSPGIWLVIMAVSAMASIQLWRLAGRPIPPGGGN